MANNQNLPWEVVEHSWSDASIIDSKNKTVLAISIYDEATEENQEELMMANKEPIKVVLAPSQHSISDLVKARIAELQVELVVLKENCTEISNRPEPLIFRALDIEGIPGVHSTSRRERRAMARRLKKR